MDDSDKDSEFDSEVDEIENEMYAKLYFLDSTPDTTVPPQSPLSNRTTSNSGSKDVKNAGGPASLSAEEQDLVVKGEHRRPAVDPRLTQKLLEAHQSQHVIRNASLRSKVTKGNETSASLTVEEMKKTESSLSQEGLNECISLKVTVTIDDNASEPHKRTVAETQVSQKSNGDLERGQCSQGSGNTHLPEDRRKRMSSICSVESISGKKPLDELYLYDDAEESDSSELSLKLAMSCCEKEHEKDLTKVDSSKDSQKGKKRQREESESSDEALELKKNFAEADSSENSEKIRKRQEEKYESSDNEEDSKCQQMNSINAEKDRKLSGGSDTVVLEDTSIDSDSSVCVLPPPKKRSCETVTLEDTDEEDSCNNSWHNVTEKIDSLKTKTKEPQSKICTKVPAPKGRQDTFSDESSSEFEDDLNQSETNLSMNIDSKLADTLEKMANKHNQTEASTSIQRNKSDTILLLSSDEGRAGSFKSLCKDQDAQQRKQRDAQNQSQVLSQAHWTAEMVMFYNTDIAEDLRVVDIHRKQSDLPQYWMISKDDLPNKQRRRYFMKEVRCLRCRQFGHLKKDCPRVPHCHLCSGTTHTARHLCPNNCCFRCGKEPHMICPDTLGSAICKVCGCEGHKSYLCPDYWRRYHLTTEGSNPIIPLEPPFRPSVQAWCFVCARKGHFGHQCPRRHLSKGYIPVPHTISSYDCPTYSEGGVQALDMENMDPERGSGEEPFAVSILPVRQQDGSRIIGKKGAVIKLLQAKTKCTITFVNNEDNPQFRIYGTIQGRQKAEKLIKMLLRTRRSKGRGFEELLKKTAEFKNDPTFSKPLPVGGAVCKKNTAFSPQTVGRNNNLEKSGLIRPEIYHIDFGEGNLTGVMSSIPNKRLSLISRLKDDVDRAANCEYNLLHALRGFMEQQLSTSKNTNKYSIAAFIRQYKRLAMIVFGHRRVGDGKVFHKRTGDLLQELQSQGGPIVSRELKREAAEVLGMVYNPDVDKAESIVELARKQLGFTSERLEAMTKKIKNRNSKSLKTKVTSRKRKKKKKIVEVDRIIRRK